MEQCGCLLDVMMYGLLIIGLGKDGEVGKVYKLFVEMKCWGWKFDVMIYIVLMDVFCKFGCVDDVLEFFDEMK